MATVLSGTLKIRQSRRQFSPYCSKVFTPAMQPPEKLLSPLPLYEAIGVREHASPLESLIALTSAHPPTNGEPFDIECFGGKFDQQMLLHMHHVQAFYDWLKAPLDDQKMAVARHLHKIGLNPAGEMVTPEFVRYLPNTTTGPEGQLFEADLKVVLLLLQAELDQHSRAAFSATTSRLAACLKAAKTSVGSTAVTLQDLGELLKISANHLGRIFRRHTGFTFHKYLLTRRMCSALDLLTSDAASCIDVATRLGYRDPANFFRDFRKVFQMTPATYLRRSSDPLFQRFSTRSGKKY